MSGLCNAEFSACKYSNAPLIMITFVGPWTYVIVIHLVTILKLVVLVIDPL